MIMKKLFNYLSNRIKIGFALILSLCFLISITSCDSDDDNNCQGIDCLPPITQTGVGTFGCLVNGEPYFAFGGVNAQYQLIDGEYFFVVGSNRESGTLRSIILESTKMSISESDFILGDFGENKIYSFIRLSENNLSTTLYTSDNNVGSLSITKLDQTNQIVSGTFEFEILNPDDGQIYQITEGRFDSFYAR